MPEPVRRRSKRVAAALLATLALAAVTVAIAAPAAGAHTAYRYHVSYEPTGCSHYGQYTDLARQQGSLTCTGEREVRTRYQRPHIHTTVGRYVCNRVLVPAVAAFAGVSSRNAAKTRSGAAAVAATAAGSYVLLCDYVFTPDILWLG